MQENGSQNELITGRLNENIPFLNTHMHFDNHARSIIVRCESIEIITTTYKTKINQPMLKFRMPCMCTCVNAFS